MADPVAPTFEMRDPLAEALGALPPGGTFRYVYGDAVRLCGHSCPTVALAWLATKAALDALYPDTLPVRGEIAVTVGGARDDGSSGPISSVVGLVTGAAPETGFGGLLGRWRRKDLLRFDPDLAGRLRFRRLDTETTVEVALTPERIPAPPDLGPLLAAILTNRADPDTRARFAATWRARVEDILAGDRDRVVQVVQASPP